MYFRGRKEIWIYSTSLDEDWADKAEELKMEENSRVQISTMDSFLQLFSSSKQTLMVQKVVHLILLYYMHFTFYCGFKTLSGSREVQSFCMWDCYPSLSSGAVLLLAWKHYLKLTDNFPLLDHHYIYKQSLHFSSRLAVDICSSESIFAAQKY